MSVPQVQSQSLTSSGTLSANKDRCALVELVRLADVAEVRTGLAKNEARASLSGEHYPYLRVANVQDGYLDLSEVRQIVVSKGSLGRYVLQKDDVLLTEGGDFDKLGRGAVWSGEISPCLHQNHVFAVRCNPKLILAEYLSLYCGSSLGKRYFLGCSKQTTNLASINSSQLKAMPILLPPVSEQRRIADAAAAWDHALATSGQLIAAKRRRKTVAVATLLANTPSTLGYLGDIADVNPRQPIPDTLSEVAFVGMEDVTEFAELGRWRTIQRPAKSSGYTPFRNGDVIVAKITPCFENGKGAIIAGLPSAVGLGSTEFHVLRPKRERDGPFVHQLTKLSRFRTAGAIQMTGSAGQQRVPAEFIRDFQFPIPGVSDRDRIGAILRLLDDEIMIEEAMLAKLVKQRRTLVEQLLSGSTSETDEAGG